MSQQSHFWLLCCPHPCPCGWPRCSSHALCPCVIGTSIMSLCPATSSCSCWLCHCQPGPGGSASTGAERGRGEITNSLWAGGSRLLLQPLSPGQVCSVGLHECLQPVQMGEIPSQALGCHWQGWESWCAPSATLPMASSTGTGLCQELGSLESPPGGSCPRTQQGLAAQASRELPG